MDKSFIKNIKDLIIVSAIGCAALLQPSLFGGEAGNKAKDRGA